MATRRVEGVRCRTGCLSHSAASNNTDRYRRWGATVATSNPEPKAAASVTGGHAPINGRWQNTWSASSAAFTGSRRSPRAPLLTTSPAGYAATCIVVDGGVMLGQQRRHCWHLGRPVDCADVQMIAASGGPSASLSARPIPACAVVAGGLVCVGLTRRPSALGNGATPATPPRCNPCSPARD